ncbi:MAG: HAMP domain-containing protein [Chloroflexi bacterium]|nr:HAMP domain-containing protein [Chloroflexota bacterium]
MNDPRGPRPGGLNIAVPERQDGPIPRGPAPLSGDGASDSGFAGGPLRPLVDLVAGIQASVHTKLLAGFLLGAVLLLGMAMLSLVVIGRMSQRVGDLNRYQEKVDRARQMEYLVTAQSHFRAMALLTRDDANNDKIAGAKQGFANHLDTVERLSPETPGDFFQRVREADGRFAASSARVLGLYQGRNDAEAMRLHLSEEHPVSHELEAAMRELERDAERDMHDAVVSFQADRDLLSNIVLGFSGVSLVSALLLGFVLSWSFIRPVRRIDRLLAGIAAGDFAQRIEVPNRDEFGTLTSNLNMMSHQLATLYEELRSINENLQHKVDQQVAELDRAKVLKQYLSPQLAESILSGDLDVNLASSRKNLTVFFSDIRGFTPLSERMEPEELVDHLNKYLTTMTEIVFKYGGTLDKYIGDAIMVFFGDPIPYEDHAARAVKMALEMRAALAEFQKQWFVGEDEVLTIGMGISTGYVTVGNIGSSSRLEYTVLGNTVNLASRLADQAKPGQILISERTLVAARDLVDATEVDQVELEGVSRPVKIYEISEKSS